MVGVCAFGLGAFSAFFPRACFEIYLGETAGWSGFVDIHDFFFLYSFIPFSLRPSFGPPSDVLLAPEPAKTEAPEAVNTQPLLPSQIGLQEWPSSQRGGTPFVRSTANNFITRSEQNVSAACSARHFRPRMLSVLGLALAVTSGWMRLYSYLGLQSCNPATRLEA